ncbi:MAG: hypothetical protein EOP04_09830 [Proteobacteria bacterium]|nr:MAG: hypothetical protein EOP04_09830 [Pseudomonadota bacterium]
MNEWDVDGKLSGICQNKASAEDGLIVARFVYDEVGARIMKIGTDGDADTIYFGSFFEAQVREKQWVKHILGAGNAIVSSRFAKHGDSLTLSRWWSDLLDIGRSVLNGDTGSSVLATSDTATRSNIHPRILALYTFAIALAFGAIWLFVGLVLKGKRGRIPVLRRVGG